MEPEHVYLIKDLFCLLWQGLAGRKLQWGLETGSKVGSFACFLLVPLDLESHISQKISTQLSVSSPNLLG